MIFEHMETDYTHINTVMTNGLIHFQNLNCMSHTMQYKIKLKDTSVIKLVNIFKDKKYFGDNPKKLQSFVVDWGDDTVTKIFTEYVNTNVYNTDSSTRLTHHYTVPMNSEIVITIMSESETLVPVPYDESVDSIEVYAMAGELATITKDITTPFHPVLKHNLVEVYSLRRYSNRTLFQNYNGTKLDSVFKGFSKLKSIYGDIFLYGCEKVVEMHATFNGCIALSSVPNNLLNRMPKLKYISFMFKDCKSIRSIGRIFHNKPIEVLLETFRGCTSLNYVHPDNFRNKKNLNIQYVFEGCTNFTRALSLHLFKDSTFTEDGLEYSFSKIDNLDDSDTTAIEEFISKSRNFRYMFSGTRFSTPDTSPKPISVKYADGYMEYDTKTDNVYEKLEDNTITLIPNEVGEVNIDKMFSNRSREVMSKPFIFSDGIGSINYIDVFKGSRSLYNDHQIFGPYININKDTGLEMIEATITYTLNILKPNTTVYFIHAHNKFNPTYRVQPKAKAYVKTGYGNEIVNLITPSTDNSSDGFVGVLYQTVGTYKVEVKYTHCAPPCLTYKNTSDKENYTIESANIELFPMEKPYVGLYGCELWCAKNITGDFFKLFYDVPNTNVFEWKATPNVWMNRIFAYFDKSVVSVSNDIFKSIGYLGNITELNELFKYEFKTGTGRTMFNNEDFYISVNPFATFNGDIFRFTPEVTKVDTWFNEPVNFKMIQISGVNLNNLFSRLTKIKVINKVLHACELYATTNDNKILWTNNNLVEEIVSYIGRVNYLATDLLVKPKLKKVNRFHLLHMVNGADKVDFTNCSMDFANSVNDIDLTEMFFDEHFEIPDGFIKNVKGTLKFNNCFKGSYRFDIANDNSLFVNVANKTSGDVSGMNFISLIEPLSMEFNGFTTETGTIGLKLKDKDGANHRVIARVYRKDSERYKLICTKHLTVTDTDTIPSLNLISGTLDVKLELWCTTANIYLENLSLMTVKNLSGVYGRTQWINRVRMQDAYPGLVPSNIICTDLGGPWRNVTPTNGVIDFTEMFTGIANKDLIDYRILKTNSPAKTTYNLTGTFRDGSIADFDIRMFEFIGDMLINGTSMYRSNNDENFKFINLESGPYIFMEILFTKFITASQMFYHAYTPKTLFNNAPYFGCDRDGNVVTYESLTLVSMNKFLSRHTTSYLNYTTIDSLPIWRHDYEIKVNDIHDFILNCRYKLSDSYDYSSLPNNPDGCQCWAGLSPFYEYKVRIDKLHLHTLTSQGAGSYFDGPNSRIKIKLISDYKFITSNSTVSGVYNCDRLFRNTQGAVDIEDFKYLMEPFDDTFVNKDVKTAEGFGCFKTYAPDNILFRNVKSFTGTSGAELLTYPNFIEYQNIHLTGNQVTFIREELDPNHRFSTYLTVFINYGSGYEEAKWFIVDKNADSYTIDLETSKITNNVVSIKIQSTQCFYLMKTNVDYVEKLEGTYRKDLQPRDSEFFNFDVEYYYFIERFGADLWRDVKIKQGDKFRFGKNDYTVNKLKSIDGSPFRTQGHITAINYLFKECRQFVVSDTIFTGLSSVSYSYSVLYSALSSNTLPNNILSPLLNTLDLGHFFAYIKNIQNIPVDIFKNKTKLLYINNMFMSTSIDPSVILPKEFWWNLPNGTFRFKQMFAYATGISRDNLDQSFIKNQSFTFTSTTITEHMFSGTNLLDVRISWIKEGSLVSANSIDMFKGCYTYEERTAFETRYGNQTGVTFKCHEAMIYKSSTANLTGTFKFVDVVNCPNKDTEYVKVVVDSGVYYRTLTELENTGITVATSKVEIYSDYAIAFDCPNVERLEGRYPAKNGEVSNNIYFKIGYKYPNLTYIDPHLFDKLVNQTDMSGVFSNLSDISLIQGTLMAPMTKLMYVNSMYAGAKGSISALLDITKYIGPSTNITRYYNLFDSVDIKQIGTGALKIRNTASVNLNNVFNGCNTYVNKDPFEGTIVGSVDGLFSSCKSVYTESELIKFNKTGNSMINTLNFFSPTINIASANTEVQLLCINSAASGTDTMDIFVDWGDGTTNIILGTTVSSLSNYNRIYSTTGNKVVRLWSSLHAISIKAKTDITSASSIVTSLGGYVGRYIDSATEGYINKYFPNATSISSEFIRDVNYTIEVSRICRNSKITHLPSTFLKRNGDVSNLQRAFTFMGMEELTSIDPNFFVEAAGASLNALGTFGLFSNTHKLIMSADEFENVFKPIQSLDTSGNWTYMFENMGMTLREENIRTLLRRFTGPTINMSDMMSMCSVYEPRLIFDAILEYNKKISQVIRCFKNSNIIISSEHLYLINKNILNTGTVPMSFMFANSIINGVSINGTNSRLDTMIVNGVAIGTTLGIESSLTGLRSVYTESEMFGGNTTTGVSGLVTDPRTVMSMKVSAGTLSLKPYTNPSYNGKLLIKVNNLVHSLNPYANKSITVAENDIVELITFDNIKDAYMLVDTVGSTAKVKELGGVFNIGPASITEGKFNKTIAECFGTNVETISDTFFTQFNTVTSAQNLCKGITSLRTIPNRILSPMVNVTNWANMFEGCTSLQLTDNNSEMFVTANKGVTFDYMFKQTGITYIPPRFFKGCTQPNKTFIGVFMLCNLTSIPADIDTF